MAAVEDNKKDLGMARVSSQMAARVLLHGMPDGMPEDLNMGHQLENVGFDSFLRSDICNGEVLGSLHGHDEAAVGTPRHVLRCGEPCNNGSTVPFSPSKVLVGGKEITVAARVNAIESPAAARVSPNREGRAGEGLTMTASCLNDLLSKVASYPELEQLLGSALEDIRVKRGGSGVSSSPRKDSNNGLGVLQSVLGSEPISDQEVRRLSWADEVEKMQPARVEIPNYQSPGKWVMAVKGRKNSTMQMDYHAPSLVNGVARVKPPVDIFRKGAAHWSNTLVGYFLDKKLSFNLIYQNAIKYWGKENVLDVLTNDSGFYFFRFKEGFDVYTVLTGGPWYFAGRPIILRKWRAGLVLSKESMKTIPIWVNFYHVPLEAWTAEGLSYIASAIGKPLFADRMTEELKRIKYARVCVEVNAENPLPEKVEIELENGSVAVIDVEYGWVPRTCSKCKMFGHLDKNCTKVVGSVWKPCAIKVPSTNTEGVPTDPSIEEEQTDGWVQVSSRGKSVASAPINVSSPSAMGPTTSKAEDQIQCVEVRNPKGELVSSMPTTQLVQVSNSFQCLEEGTGEEVDSDIVTPIVDVNLTPSNCESSSVTRPVLQLMNLDSAISANPLRDKLVAVDELDSKRQNFTRKHDKKKKNSVASAGNSGKKSYSK